jgi:hypothetical protein
MKMEIPTEEIIEQLDSRFVNGILGPVALEAIDTIKAQALEILHLQLVVVRLREENQMLAHNLATGKALK